MGSGATQGQVYVENRKGGCRRYEKRKKELIGWCSVAVQREKVDQWGKVKKAGKSKAQRCKYGACLLLLFRHRHALSMAAFQEEN